MSLLYWLLGLNQPREIVQINEWIWQPVSPLPLWTVILLALFGFIAAGLNFLPHNVMTWKMRTLLAAIRLAGFGLLLLMLCQLEARLTVERDLRPTVALLTDTSASMGLADVNGQTRLAAAQNFTTDLLKSLAGRAEIVRYQFDWQLEPETKSEVSQRPTRLMESIAEAARRENPLRALIVLSDGNDTAGDRGERLAPLLAARGLPVFPVVFGSEDTPKLARVKIASATDYVRLGDEFRITAMLSAHEIGEQQVTVRLEEQGRAEPLAVRENIRLGKDPAEITFVIKPDKEGEKKYQVRVEGVKGSATQDLLAAEQRVSVLNSKIQVLYVDIPRDERKILAHWLARDPVVDLATLTLLPRGGWYAQGEMRHKNAGEGLPGTEADLYKYDVIIFGDIPRSYFREGGDTSETKMQWLSEFVSRRGGGLVTLGGRNVYAAGQYQDSPLARLAPFTIEATQDPQVPKPFRITPTVAGLGHPLMRLESDPTANRDAWYDLPTLDGNNRVGKIKPGASLLAVREMEQGPLPIIALQNVGKGQVLGLAADTTWRWEMMRPAEGEDYFRRFWGNAMRSLAPDPRIQPDRPQILRQQSQAVIGRRIQLSTRLVDSVYQPIRNADIQVKISRPSGKATHYFPRDGRDTPGLYEYEIELNEPGDWKVEVTHQGKTTTEIFTVGNGLEELDDPRAHFTAMQDFAQATGGRAFTPSQTEELLKALNLNPRRVTDSEVIAFWNLPLTMGLLIALVCLDAWLRKRRGMA